MRRLRSAAAWHFVAIAGALALAAAVSARPLWHDDLFLHLRTGEMVARTGHVPTTDPFTHTVHGAPWTSHEWGFGLLAYGVYRLGGFRALVGLMPVLLACALAAIYLQMRRAMVRERLAVVAPLLLLGLGAGERTCLVLRAALVTSLCLALLVHLLERLHESGRTRHVIAIAALFLVWANMHAGVVFGLCVVGLHVVQAGVDQWRGTEPGRRWGSVWRGVTRERVLLLCGCAALTLLNPSGFDLWTFSYRVNKLFYASDIQWTMGQYTPPLPRRYPAFFVLVALTLAACVPLRRLERVLRDSSYPGLAHALGTAFFLVMALRANRFILDFVVFALPFCAMAWGGRVGVGAPDAAGAGVSPPPSRWFLGRSWSEAFGAAVVVACALVVRPSWPHNPIADRVPARLADFMRREHVSGRMFNQEAFGGYLGWRLRQPVYWDGRNDIFYPVAREFVSAPDFGDLVRRHGLDMLVMDRKYHHRFHDYLASHGQEWGLVYWDDVSALYVKRIPRFRALLERWEYALLRPFGVPAESEVRRLIADPGLRREAETEIARALSQSDDTFAAWYLRGRIAQGTGDLRAAYDALGHAVRLSPKADALYQLARVARDLGKPDEARALLDRYMALVRP